MDNQRQQHYLPGPPPPPGGQGNMSYLPPPPPRSHMGMPPPPPGPHPSAYPPGTVFGLPQGWNQSYGRPGMGHLPPPPPMGMNQSQQQQYNMGYNQAGRGQSNLPPPPPRQGQEDMPLVSATFIPGGDSFGPGVGIPPLDDFSTFSGYDGNYDPAAYAEQTMQAGNHVYNNGNPAYNSKPTSAGPDSGTRENRAASTTSNRPKFPQLRENPEPMSPGPPTATLVNPTPGRPRAQSAMVPQNGNADLANQWPLERILLWLAANSFSHEWQETFRVLRLEKGEFLELGRSTDKRSNLSRMHQYIYPQLGKICQHSGMDAKKEREDGKRLQRLIAGILLGPDGASSAGTGHRRRESGLTSASTEGNVENSPHLGGSATPSTTGPEGSPARSHFGPGFSQRSAQERSSTLPVFSKSGSSGSTPAERQHAESFGPPVTRGDYTRGVLNGIGNRGRHSPNLSGDAAAGGLSLRQESSPGHSPALGHSLPSQAQSTPHLPLREPPSKAQSADTFQKATGFARNNAPSSILTTEVPLGAGRFYETQKDRTDSRPETHRAYSNDTQTRDHSNKSFLSKVFQRKRHDPNDPLIEENSPTSPRDFMQKLPFAKSQANHSDTALAQRPTSANTFLESVDVSQKRTPKRFILVTPDYWNYRLIDVTDVESAIALKNKIGAELGITDMDYAQIHITEPGKMDHEEPLTDASLAAARGAADSAGSLKFFVHSPTLSAVSMPQTDGLGIVSNQARQNVFLKQAPSLTGEELRKAAEEYQHENEKKRLAYLQSRQERRGQTSEAGTPVFDFDHPSPKGFPEDGKEEQLVPHRKPPAAPSASHTLAKVNSLRMASQHRSRSSLDGNKRLSDSLNEEPSPRQKRRFDPSGGIGAAIANSSKVAVLPAAANGQRSPRTVTIGNKDAPKPRMPTRQDTAGSSPQIGPATDSMPRAGLSRTRSYGPDYEFKETNVAFSTSPNPQAASKDDSDDDSDDGLFAIKIRPKAETPKRADQRPALTVDTDQPPGGKRKSVAFKTPSSNDGASAGPGNTGDDSANTGTSDGYNQRSFSGGSGSWEERSPEESRARPNSFHSDIWANRPVVENIVGDLDKFFPGVDLDKPFMEEGDEGSPMQGNQTPMSDIKARLGNITFGTTGLDLDFREKNDSDTLGSDESTLKANQKNKIANVASRQMSKAGGLGRMKSIREVARKRNDIERGPSVAYRAQQAQQPPTSMPMRRKSTKMFGANIVQIKPQRGNRLSVLEPIPQEDIPNEDTPKRQATFKIIRGQLIGKGTYGRVYLGMNATTGEFLAVKQVEVNHKAAAHDKDRIAEMVKALDVEIDTMQHLEHPNIVQYLGFERKEYSMSIYLEYISGGSVGSCLRKHGKFEEPVVKSMTIQTLKGLKYLHDESILHRDLKADNILLDLDGTCKISDFGISKKSDDIYRDDITNSMQGSVFWMAPEVVRTDGQGYSAKVDIWSLGCVVLEMFAGKRPWSREEAIGAIFKLGSLQQAPPIPDDVQATASIDGLAFMYDCFQVNPLDRPTAKTLLEYSNFCRHDPHYNFYDTELAAKLRTANLMPQT
ncbi:mitogen-activated protein kinase kinase kinase [Knufia fluminis]|uniref:Mitogen-activated protein kinase kinae kinase bck1 n=1 Tax=Knufia fluminis TaxID=191047 RepID=A0AAN8ED82_9EURO|nr:mitogen-activated protein kinase kinase kinase [Knufia fluminis]